MRKKFNWLGKQSGYLTVIAEQENMGQLVMWLCKCICGKEVVRNANDLKRKRILSCGCKHGNRKYSPIQSSAAAIFQSNYSDGNLTFDTFFALSQENCYYCGANPSNSHKSKCGDTFIYNGLDRLDSKIPHLLLNCVPCCRICNSMKSDLSKDNFLAHIKKIIIKQAANEIIY